MKGTREIDKNHSKFLLMYNMLSGIRITVSRCESRPDKDLTPDDYTAAHKIASDVAGTELEPKDNYDFKFKDYSPMVFRKIRQCFGLSSTDYLNSLTGKYVLSELDSPGKSGSFFYFSHDYRFIIKTIHTSEHNLLRKILPHYLLHITQNPHTLLARFYGLHRVKAPGKAPVHFVVMTNVFPSNKDIHEIYDLKGSSVGRFISEEEAKGNPKAVLKDINWMNRQRKLELGPEKRKAIIEQLEKDVEFLKKSGIMDYSLLVGIHDLKRGNMEGLRDTMLSVFEPNQDTLSRTAAQAQGMQGDKRMSRVMAVKAAIKESHPIALGPSSSKLPEVVPEERKLSMFYAEDGGLRSTNEQNIPTDELYFIGIIDILTPYNAAKKVEHWWKSLSNDRKGISAVHPTLYGKRFLGFMKGIFKHIE
ncbi:SAICAR synthase-like protein [Paraphysoderma sedebokerense]|nr:SAICAR synthase-like protein [Paraphysoderma sedebokerense]